MSWSDILIKCKQDLPHVVSDVYCICVVLKIFFLINMK